MGAIRNAITQLVHTFVTVKPDMSSWQMDRLVLVTETSFTTRL